MVDLKLYLADLTENLFCKFLKSVLQLADQKGYFVEFCYDHCFKVRK